MRTFLAMTAVALMICVALPAQCTVGTPGPGGTEDFDGATPGSPGTYPTNWVDGGGGTMWWVDSGGTPSFNTGPSDDKTGGGNYLYIETSTIGSGVQAIIETPCYSLGGYFNPVLDFSYHMFGMTIDTLEVERDDGAGGWIPLWSLTGDQGDQWNRAQVDLTGTTARFRFIATGGTSFTGDIAIDDVRIGERQQADYNVNSANASLDFDGVQGTEFEAAVTTVPIGTLTTLNVASALGPGTPYEIYIALGLAVPRYLTSANGQVINVPIINDPTFAGFNGGVGNVNGFAPYPGDFSLMFTVPVPLEAVAQSIYINAGDPDGWTLSQPASLKVIQDPALGPANTSGSGTNLSLTDDSFSMQALGFTLNYFGTGYTDIYVGSNGHCTFVSGDSGWASGGPDLNANDPTIAVCAEDFNPSAGGTVEINVMPILQTVEVWWQGVPSFPSVGSNTFKLTISPNLILFDYDGAMTELEGTVGLSAGGGTNALFPVNLSAAGGLNGPILVPAGTTPFEDFPSGTPIDLPGFQVSWILDASGNPLSIQ